MIGVLEMETVLSNLLTQKGIFVVAPETTEGHQRPCCSFEMFPSASERESSEIVRDTFGVQLEYYPKTEDRGELVRAADDLKNIILRNPLCVEDRRISCYQIEFSREKGVLFADFEYILQQRYPDLEEENIPFSEDLDFDFY